MNQVNQSPLQPRFASALQDLAALEEDADSLTQLHNLLAGFNLFNVLRVEEAEIRHSNVLAWLLDSRESHGLGTKFASAWLAAIKEEMQKGHSGTVLELPDPGMLQENSEWRICPVREWGGDSGGARSIDLVVEIRIHAQAEWVLCIENKINHIQTAGQLADYRAMIHRRYGSSCKLVFLFLSKSGEKPDDPAFASVTYHSVDAALSKILRDPAVQEGLNPEVKSFLTQYQTILNRYLMNQSIEYHKAREIYRKHRKAIDYIFTVRYDNRSELTNLIAAHLERAADELGLVLLRMGAGEGLVRFVPRSWYVPSNIAPDAKDWCQVFCQLELCAGSSNPHLIGTTLPLDGENQLLPVAARLADSASKNEFAHATTLPPSNGWYAFYRNLAPHISIQDLEEADLEPLAEQVFSWVRTILQSEEFETMASCVSKILPKE